jgi:hypothetical protein
MPSAFPVVPFFAALLLLSPLSPGAAQSISRLTIELEAGPVWQSRNKVQIPNDPSGTRFSLEEVAGRGPWPSGRAYVTWNLDRRHSLRALLAPLSITETGAIPGEVRFAGETFRPHRPVEATYQFNSWRLGYGCRFMDREDVSLWVGFTAKLRDAKVELRQDETSARDTDLGFVPLLFLAGDKRLAPRWRLRFDFDGLAGGPGRAFDAALKLHHDLGDRWGITAGYRTLEGGADVESLYNFAWLHYGVVSGVFRW